MTLRYSDTENMTKTLTRPDWKVKLVQEYFKANGVKDPKAAREMLLRWGWTLSIKPHKKDKRLECQVLDTKGKSIFQFECDS